MREINQSSLFTNQPIAEPRDTNRRWVMEKGATICEIKSILVNLYIIEPESFAKFGTLLNEGKMHLTNEIGPEGHRYVFFEFDKPILRDGVYSFGFIIEGHRITPADDSEFVHNLAGENP